MTCTFFGHRDCPKDIEQSLRCAIIDLIEKKEVNKFYVGNQGNFDSMVYRTLKNLSKKYTLEYDVVLAYLPHRHNHYDKTIFPEGIENVPPRFAINHRNKWMIDHSDFVITYVRYSLGGAAKFKELAIKQNKIVINL